MKNKYYGLAYLGMPPRAGWHILVDGEDALETTIRLDRKLQANPELVVQRKHVLTQSAVHITWTTLLWRYEKQTPNSHECSSLAGLLPTVPKPKAGATAAPAPKGCGTNVET